MIDVNLQHVYHQIRVRVKKKIPKIEYIQPRNELGQFTKPNMLKPLSFPNF